MDLLSKSINYSSFGLREKFYWTLSNPQAPWMSTCITWKEKRYIYRIVQDVFYWSEMNIQRVENPYLWGRYVLRYEEMRANPASNHVYEDIGVHATSISNAWKIADSNFDWRLVKRHRFGRGVSFAEDADYADAQATENDAYIISGILIANIESGNYGTYIPSYFSDTTANRQDSVYVKYNDNEFYPYYIVY